MKRDGGKWISRDDKKMREEIRKLYDIEPREEPKCWVCKKREVYEEGDVCEKCEKED